MKKHLILGVVLALPVLSACDATRYNTGAVVLDISEPQAFSFDAGTSTAFVEGYEALQSGDYPQAEAFLDRALRQKPRDPYALLAMGAVHEQTGRAGSAAEYYRSAERYGESASAAVEPDSTEQGASVAVVARANLARLNP